MPVRVVKSSICLVGVMAIGLTAGCGPAGTSATRTASIKVLANVAAPTGLTVQVSGTSAAINWAVPKGLTVPLTGFVLYLDQDEPVNLGPNVTSRELSGLVDGSQHYVQIVAQAANNQSTPVSASFNIAFKAPRVTPAPTQTVAPAPVAVATPAAQPTTAVAPVAPPVTPPPVVPSVTTLSVSSACATVVSDMHTVDNAAASAIRGDSDEVNVGHSFGPLIIEMRAVAQQVTDSRLSQLIQTVNGDILALRNYMVAGGDLLQATMIDSFTTDAAAITSDCSAQADPLSS